MDATLDGRLVKISRHAIRRYAERFSRDEEAMRDQLSRAVLFGAQRGEDRTYLDDDTAFVLDRFGVVKTTLTKNMLFANMQVAFRGLRYCEPINGATKISEVDLKLIASLAAQHCLICFPSFPGKRLRKTRNRQLREHGIVPQSEHEKIYKEMFLKAFQEMLAEKSSNEHATNNQLLEAKRLAK